MVGFTKFKVGYVVKWSFGGYMKQQNPLNNYRVWR